MKIAALRVLPRLRLTGTSGAQEPAGTLMMYIQHDPRQQCGALFERLQHKF